MEHHSGDLPTTDFAFHENVFNSMLKKNTKFHFVQYQINGTTGKVPTASSPFFPTVESASIQTSAKAF